MLKRFVMKCKYCNAELEDSAKFCRFCGRKQDSEAAGTSEKGKSKAKYIIIPIAITAGVLSFIMIAIVIVIIAFILMNGAKEDVGSVETVPGFDTTDRYYNEEDLFDTGDEYENEETVPETTYAPDTTDAPETEPPVSSNENVKVAIAHGGLRMRNKPDLTYGAVVGLIPNGTLITVERVENNWAYTCVDGVFGWCSCDFLFTPYEQSDDPIYVATVSFYNGVDLSTEVHGTGSDFYTIIPDGERVYVYKIDGTRAFVKYNNIYGWCSTEHLTMRDVP